MRDTLIRELRGFATELPDDWCDRDRQMLRSAADALAAKDAKIDRLVAMLGGDMGLKKFREEVARARDEALEEAARAADEHAKIHAAKYSKAEPEWVIGIDACDDVARAIRALKDRAP